MYGNQLPVPADQVYSDLMVSQLPPMPTQLPFDPQMAQKLHSTMVSAIQQKADRSYLRAFLFNLTAQQQFQNQAYAELLQRAAEYFMVLAGNGVSDETFNKAVEETIITEFPSLVSNYPALQQYLQQEQMREIQQLLQIRQEIGQAIAAHSQGGQQGYMGGGQQMGFQPPMNRGPAMGGGYGMGMGNQQRGGFGGNMGYGGGYGQPASPQRPSRFQASPMAGVDTTSRLTSGPGPSSRENSGSRPSHSLSQQKVETAPPKVQGENVSYHKGETVFEDKIHRELRHESRRYSPPVVKTSNGGEDPSAVIERVERYRPLVRTNQIVVTKIKDQVPVFEIQESSDMNYEDFETDTNMIRLHRSQQSGPKVVRTPKWHDLTSVNEVSTIATEDDGETGETPPDDQNLFINRAPITITDEVVEGYSLQQIHMEVRRILANAGYTELDERVYEFQARLRTPIIVEDSNAYNELSKFVAAAPKLDDLVKGFDELSSVLHPHTWYLIHDRLTARFNERLEAGLAFEGTIDSVVDDYEDIFEELRKDYTESAIERFKTNARVTLLKSIGVEKNPTEDAVYLTELYYIAYLPWSSEDIDLIGSSTYGLLTKAANEDMQIAVGEMFERSNKQGQAANRRYMVTQDHVRLSFHSTDLGDAHELMVSVQDSDQ